MIRGDLMKPMRLYLRLLNTSSKDEFLRILRLAREKEIDNQDVLPENSENKDFKNATQTL